MKVGSGGGRSRLRPATWDFRLRARLRRDAGGAPRGQRAGKPPIHGDLALIAKVSHVEEEGRMYSRQDAENAKVLTRTGVLARTGQRGVEVGGRWPVVGGPYQNGTGRERVATKSS